MNTVTIPTTSPTIPIMMGSFLRAGHITTRTQAGLPSGANNDLPALYGEFSEIHFKLNAGASMHLGYGMLYRDGPAPLTFRLQIGTSQLFWLADPRAPEVWTMLDAWSRAKRMVCLIDVNGRVGMASQDYPGIPPEVEKQRQYIQTEEDSRFVPELLELITSGQLATNASSDIPYIPQLKHIEMCLVSTPQLTSELALLGMPMTKAPG